LRRHEETGFSTGAVHHQFAISEKKYASMSGYSMWQSWSATTAFLAKATRPLR